MGILDLNKSEIGRLAGLSRTTTSDILRGVQEGDLGQLDLICDVLGLTLWQEVKAAEDATESRRLKRLAG
jgi:transcriptional regulator with XRE-family HTH domain